MQSFSLRRDQERLLHDILDRGLDSINQEETEREERPRQSGTSRQKEERMEVTERPKFEDYISASGKTEKQYEDPYWERKREEEQRKFELKPLEPYVEHASDGLQTEIAEVQTRMKILESQLQGADRSFPSPQHQIIINPATSLKDLYASAEGEGVALGKRKKGESKEGAVTIDGDVNDYSAVELERLKWAIMEEKRIQERLARENSKLSTRVRFRVDVEKKTAEMREMIESLRLSVQKSQHLRRNQKDLIRVIQFQIDRKRMKTVGERYPTYLKSLRRPGRGKHHKKRPIRSIIQHGRIYERSH